MERALGVSSLLANQPSSIGRMYPPRLSKGFEFELPETELRALELQDRIIRTLGNSANQTVEVQLEGERAILRGVVESDRAKNLARLLALFEPGISEVENHLEVRPNPGAGLSEATSREPPERP